MKIFICIKKRKKKISSPSTTAPYICHYSGSYTLSAIPWLLFYFGFSKISLKTSFTVVPDQFFQGTLNTEELSVLSVHPNSSVMLRVNTISLASFVTVSH